MNRHRQMERKRARRQKRTATSRGGGRGPVTRGAERARLMNIGEGRVFAMVRSTRPAIAAKKKRVATEPQRWAMTSYGTVCRAELVPALEARHVERTKQAA
jgi:hypothetical protein